MYSVKLDENKYFTGSYASVGSIPGGVMVDSLPEHSDYPTANQLIDGAWVFDQAKADALKEEQDIETIRSKREEAFKVIDKYQLPLHYADLTTEQQEELKIYRKQWLDAPATKIIPTTLTWIE